jgi:hypothetical protein
MLFIETSLPFRRFAVWHIVTKVVIEGRRRVNCVMEFMSSSSVFRASAAWREMSWLEIELLSHCAVKEL